MDETPNSYEERIDVIKWSDFSTAYGDADVVSDQLKDLTSDNLKVAFDASHDLWCGLCHQHAYISSAALPAFPFLLEALVKQDDTLKVEILDIIYGFIVCLNRDKAKGDFVLWKAELLKKLNQKHTIFLNLQSSNDENIAGFSEGILSELNKTVIQK